MADEPTDDEIITAIRAAGWLLEQDTLGLLRAHKFISMMGKAYADQDEPTTSREIDVYGYRELFRNEDIRISLGASVLVECKQSSWPYVCIGRPLDDRERAVRPTEHVLRFDTVEQEGSVLPGGGRRIYHHDAWSWLGLDKVPGSPSLDTFRATQMTRLERKKTWSADNRGIFTQLIFPLAKALRGLQSDVRPARDRGRDHDRKYSWASIVLFFPVVVTSAPLFVIDATASPLAPARAGWVKVSREVRTKSIKGRFNVDIVTFDSFNDYLEQQVLLFAEGVAGEVRTDPERFVTRKIPPA